MFSYVELGAIANVIMALISFLLCSFFVYQLWLNMLANPDVGSVGFFLVFVSLGAFNLWDVIAYTVLALPGPEPSLLFDLTLFKPAIHGLESISYLLLYLHFRKKPTNECQG